MIFYGGNKQTVWKQLNCNHNWIGPCMDSISRYFKCKKCLCLSRNVKSEREVWDSHKKDEEHLEALKKENEKLRELLLEWLNTPYFDTEAAWDRWIHKFRPKVCGALKIEEREEPAPAEWWLEITIRRSDPPLPHTPMVIHVPESAVVPKDVLGDSEREEHIRKHYGEKGVALLRYAVEAEEKH